MLQIIHILCTVMAALSTLVISGKRVVLDCYSTTASDYDGHQQTTVSGKTCSRWDQFRTYSAAHFPDATVYDAANFCRTARYHLIWCYISGPKAWELCGINKCDDDILIKCGQLSIETPTVLGQNVTFSFTPDKYDSNANIYWQRKSIGETTWFTLDLNDKFVQYQTNKTYYLVLTDSVKHDGEQNYRIHYYNQTMRCRMETKNPDLEGDDILTKCGQLSIETPTVLGQNVTFSFTPDTYDSNANIYWQRKSIGATRWFTLYLNDKFAQYQTNKTYHLVLTDSVKHDGEPNYRVHYYNETMRCRMETKNLEEPQSLLKILGLQDRENCTNCIVGEDGEMLMVSCEINDGTRPLNVTMTIGNESNIPLLFNLTTYMAAFILREYHHMENVSCSVLNDALTSPLKATAQVFVIIVLFVVIRKRRQNPKDKDRQNWSKEQSLHIIATHSSDVDNVKEHFGHNTRGKASDEHVFGADHYTGPDHLSRETNDVYEPIEMN